jgi:(4S)-4-hydroxy-5-phosphonooxypentane-2,3-dione isomerase
LQSNTDPTHFMIYEAYQTEEAVAAHKTTPHYFAWRETVANQMAQPRRGDKFNILAPTYIHQW